MKCPSCSGCVVEEVDRRAYRGGIIIVTMTCGDCIQEWDIEEEDD